MSSYNKNVRVLGSSEIIKTKEQCFDKDIVAPWEEVVVNAIPENWGMGKYGQDYRFKIVKDMQLYVKRIESHDCYERTELCECKTDRTDFNFFILKCFREDEKDEDGTDVQLLATWK